MDIQTPLTAKDSKDVTLEDVWNTLMRARWLVFAFLASTTIAAALTAALLPKLYKATVLVSPVTSTSSPSGLGGLALGSQFSSLASLAGISLGHNSQQWESIAVLESDVLTERYIQQNHLLPILYYRKWNAEAEHWKTGDPREAPTLWKANRFFKKHVRTVNVDNKTGLVSLTITWTNPNLASQWANGLVALTNEYLRAKAIARSDREIAYLNAQAAKTTVVEARQAIYTLLENELNKSMIARGNIEYAFRVLDPAEVSEKPSTLPALAWAAIALAGSSIIAILSALLWAGWKTT